MANTKKPAVSFDDIIQQGRQKKRNEQLAQEIFGKNRRQSAPTAGNKRGPLGGSLASRVGITKQRTASVPRSNNTTPRIGRGPTRPPSTFSRPTAATTAAAADDLAGIAVIDTAGADVVPQKKAIQSSQNISFRGAAGGPYVVVASNFAPGTTAADIESVMRNVSKDVVFCRLVAASPTVIAEMGFPDLDGADAVIGTFNNKKADGRLLHVYMKNGATSKPTNTAIQPQSDPVEIVEPPAPVVAAADDSMEVDDLASEREIADRMREERRGRSDLMRDDRDRRDPFPARGRGGRGYAQDDYYRGPPRPEYGDRRYGSGYGQPQRGRYGGAGYGRGGSGQSWRP